MGRESFITCSKIQTTSDDMAFLCLLSLGHTIQRGKAYILSIEERRRCGQAYSKSEFHIRTRTRMGENIVSCDLYLLPLEVSSRQFRNMGSATGRRSDTFSHIKRDFLGRNGISTRGGGCIYRSAPNSKTWWQVYWSIKCESRILFLPCE